VLKHVGGYGLETTGVVQKMKYVWGKLFALITHFVFVDCDAVVIETFWQFLCTFNCTPLQSEFINVQRTAERLVWRQNEGSCMDLPWCVRETRSRSASKVYGFVWKQWNVKIRTLGLNKEALNFQGKILPRC
jgi:hypothetical protein